MKNLFTSLMVIVLAGAVGLCAESGATSKPATSQHGNHATVATDLASAVKSIDAASAAVAIGKPAAADIDTAKKSVDSSVQALQGCLRHIAAGKAASMPSMAAVMHNGFTKKLQDAITALDAAKVAAEKSDKAGAVMHLTTARQLVSGVQGSVPHAPAAQPVR